jgi:hypothetical protein
MANLKALNGSLIGQPTSSKGTQFNLNNIFYVGNRVGITL